MVQYEVIGGMWVVLPTEGYVKDGEVKHPILEDFGWWWLEDHRDWKRRKSASGPALPGWDYQTPLFPVIPFGNRAEWG